MANAATRQVVETAMRKGFTRPQLQAMLEDMSHEQIVQVARHLNITRPEKQTRTQLIREIMTTRGAQYFKEFLLKSMVPVATLGLMAGLTAKYGHSDEDLSQAAPLLGTIASIGVLAPIAGTVATKRAVANASTGRKYVKTAKNKKSSSLTMVRV
jgi:hypothetical protein